MVCPAKANWRCLSPYRDSLPGELFERPFRFPVDGSRPTSNVIEARNLLAAAGWRIEDGVLRDVDGEPFTLEFLSGDSTNARILLPWFQTLKQLGVEASIRLLDITQYTSRVRRHDYEALVQSNDFLMPPTLELRSNFHSSAATAEGSRNYTGVNHPAVDFLVERAESAETMAE